MRSIGASPDGYLLLNGRPVYLRGALDQDYYAHGLYTAFSDAELDEQFARAKHMGLNCLRTHIKIADPRYYDAADRAGILIWTELPNWQELTDERQAAGPRHHGRHGRARLEPPIDRDLDDRQRELGHRSRRQCRRTAPGWSACTPSSSGSIPQRLVVGNSPCFTNFHVVTDIEDFHNYYGMPDHHRQWQEWVAGVRRAARLDLRHANTPASSAGGSTSAIPGTRSRRRPRRRCVGAATSRSSSRSSATGACPTSARLQQAYGGSPGGSRPASSGARA